jgi:hypothetical protein
MTKGRFTKKQAIRNTLHRLGLQARPAEVVAALAEAGIFVAAEQVRAVLLETLREASRAERLRVEAHTRRVPLPVRRCVKVPPRRGQRR